MFASWWSRGIGIVAIVVAAPSCGTRPGEPVPFGEPAPVAEPADTPLAPVTPASRAADVAAIRQELGPSLSRSRRGLEVVETPSGTMRIPTDGRFRSAHVVTRGADGKKRIDCVTNARELDKVLERGAVR